MVSATVTAPAREAVRGGPRFGLATATFVVVSSMIGTGVLTTSGFTVYFVGSNQLMLALWVAWKHSGLAKSFPIPHRVSGNGTLTQCTETCSPRRRDGGERFGRLRSSGRVSD